MSTKAPHTDTRVPRAEFLDLVCADEQWLRAEFDAIVAANWDDESAAQLPGEVSSPRAPLRVEYHTAAVPPDASDSDLTPRGRQRSPPLAARTQPRPGGRG